MQRQDDDDVELARTHLQRMYTLTIQVHVGEQVDESGKKSVHSGMCWEQ